MGMDYIKVAGWIAVFVTALFTTYQTIIKLRRNAKIAAQADESAIQTRIEMAVQSERDRWEFRVDKDDDRIMRLKEIADEWKEIAFQRGLKNEILSDELKKVSDEVNMLKAQLETLTQLYQSSQESIGTLRAQMNRLEAS